MSRVSCGDTVSSFERFTERARQVVVLAQELRRRILPRAAIGGDWDTHRLGNDVVQGASTRVSLLDSRSLAVGGGIALAGAALGLLIWG